MIPIMVLHMYIFSVFTVLKNQNKWSYRKLVKIKRIYLDLMPYLLTLFTVRRMKNVKLRKFLARVGLCGVLIKMLNVRVA